MRLMIALSLCVFSLSSFAQGKGQGQEKKAEAAQKQEEKKAEVAEKMIVKLQAGMMPPRAAQKPAPAAHAALIAALEHTLDKAAAASPNPGRRTFQRMNS